MIETEQKHRNQAHAGDGENRAMTPPNAPEQRRGGFAAGEADPTHYPQDEEIGRFSTGQDQSEPLERGSFAQGQQTEPKAIDPEEGFAERDGVS